MKNSESGFTLIEVMVSVAIVSIIVTSFLALAGYSRSAEIQVSNNSQALQIAQNVFDDARNYIVQNETLTNYTPDTGSTKYSAYLQTSPVTNTAISTYNSSPYQGKQHVSVQGTVYLKVNSSFQAQILTVTVYWSN